MSSPIHPYNVSEPTTGAADLKHTPHAHVLEAAIIIEPLTHLQEIDPHHPCQSGHPSTPPRHPTTPPLCTQTVEHVTVAAGTTHHHAAKYHQPTQLEVSRLSVMCST